MYFFITTHFLIQVMMRKADISAQILSVTTYTCSANILCSFVCYAI